MKTRKLFNTLKNDEGYVFIEASFVYPLMFFIIFFLIYTGNMFLLKAKIDSEVASEAIRYANYFANPYVKRIEKNNYTIDTKISGSHVTDNMYRYFYSFGEYADDNEKKAFKERIAQVGLFSHIKPSNIEIKQHGLKNRVLYQHYIVEVKYKLNYPIKLIFFDDDWSLDMNAREEVTITDQSEFIRNIDWGIDIWERIPKTDGKDEEQSEEIPRLENNMEEIKNKNWKG